LLDGTKPANTPAVRNDTFPGARWLYSGGGITIAQLLATDVSGDAFPSLMNRLVLQPAGMKRSTYENPLPVARRGEAASGHEQVDTPVPGGFHVYPEMAAAGLWTNASDLARWAIALSRSYRGEPGGVLSNAMAKQMVSKQIQQQPPYGNGYWGLGVAVNGDGDSISFSHNGRDEGFVANMVMWPQKGRGFVIMMSGVQGALMSEIQRAYAEEYGLGATPRVERQLAAVGAAKLGEYVGSYSTVAGRDTVRIDASVTPGGRSITLYVSNAKRTLVIVPVGPDVFVGMDGGGEWTFGRANTDASAEVRTLASGTGQNRRVFNKQ
jgi:CubicO group peptidase (beta-lactamase class C family)